MKERFVTVRMPIEIYELLKDQAALQTRSMSSQIIHLLREFFKDKK